MIFISFFLHLYIQVRRSESPLQKGVVTQLVASRAPWIITCSEGNDTEVYMSAYFLYFTDFLCIYTTYKSDCVYI